MAQLTCTILKINSYLLCIDVQQIKDRFIARFVFGTFGTAPQRIHTYNFILLTAAGGRAGEAVNFIGSVDFLLIFHSKAAI